MAGICQKAKEFQKRKRPGKYANISKEDPCFSKFHCLNMNCLKHFIAI
jgi:hypothetical protein